MTGNQWIAPKFCKFWLTRKPFKVLQSFRIPQDLESARFGILQQLLLSFLEILKIISTQFSVVKEGVCVDIFWNTQLLSNLYELLIFLLVLDQVK